MNTAKPLRNIRLSILDLFGGTSLNATLGTLRNQQYLPSHELEALRQEEIKRIFNLAKANTEFYSNAISYEDLEVLTKDTIRNNFNSLISKDYKGKFYTKGTGGSTGIPLVYLTTAYVRSHLWAGIFLSWEAAGYSLGDKVAFIAGTSLTKSSLRHHAFYRLMNIDIYSAFTLDDQNILKYINRLKHSKARMIYGYSSALNVMATYMNKFGDFDFPFLKSIVSTAEILTDAMRENISRAFKVKVFNQYGCNEAGVSAFECSHNKMHLISPRSFFEIDKDDNLISTDLANEGFFMLKYHTGDRIKISEIQECLCKRTFPIISDIVGRSFDIVRDTNNNVLHSSFFSILFRSDNSIRQFQIQFDKKDISIYLNVDALNKEQDRYQQYIDVIKQHLQFEHYHLIINAPFLSFSNAKHRHIINTAS
jgi:phenylacetate-CoA ligase